VENPLARALLAGQFQPGSRITVDADLVGGTLVFSAGDATVVSESGDRRDARSGAGTPVGAGTGAGGGSGLWTPRTDDKPKERLN
jgi:hypothetical protein